MPMSIGGAQNFISPDQGIDPVDGQGVIFTASRNYVWDTGSLSWVRETQPGGGGGGTVNQGTPAAIANAWPIEISDQTHGPVAVKAASTGAGAADLALVVTIGPNSPLPAGTNVLGHVELDSGGTLVGQQAMAASVPVAIASNQSAVPASQSGTWAVELNSGGSLVGQQAMASSVPVTIASNQSAVPVSGTVTSNQGTPNSLANAWPMELTDATHGPVAVKPASTAAVAADPALVVAVSPNNTVAVTESGTWAVELNSGGSLVGQQAMAASVPVVIASNQSSIPVTGAGDSTSSGTALGALNATVSLATSGYAGMGLFLAAGTLQGTIIAELSYDGGTTWVTGLFFNPATSVSSQTIVFASNNPATSVSMVPFPGMSHQRVRVSAYTSGTATATLRATAADSLVSTVGGGTTVVANQGTANSLANAWPFEITDATHGPVAVKAASTAAVAADPALVVAVSPNNTVAVTESGTWAVELNSGGSLVGQQAMAASVPVTIASNQSAVPVTKSGTWAVELNSGGSLVGQQAMASSVPVTIASNQSAVPVSGTVTSNQGTPNSLANAWPMELTDATHGPVAVKPASTAAVAADPALVVAVSPNNTVAVTKSGTWAVELNSGGSLVGQQAMAASVPVVIASNQSSIPVTGAGDSTSSGTALGALNATVSLATSGYAGMGLFLAAGTLQGTIIAELSYDGGTTWVTGLFFNPATSVSSQTIVFASNNPATSVSMVPFPGMSHQRVRVSAYTSGTATATLRATAADSLVSTVGGGTTVVANQGTANSLANAWPFEITDATHGPVAVKAASTAAVAADPALVVAVSPNNTVAVTESGTWAVELNSGGSLVGQQAMAASVPVTIASNQSAVPVTESGTWAVELNSGGSLVGQQAMAASVPVVIASNQTSVPVTATISGTVSVNGTVTALTIAGEDYTTSGNLNSNGASVSGQLGSSATGGQGPGAGIGVLIAAGSLAATVVAEISYDGGTTWVASQFYNPATAVFAASLVFTNPNSATSELIVTYPGVSNARVRVSAYTSGVAVATLRTTFGNTLLTIANFPATQPISGTVTANQGTANSLANAWPHELTDGTTGPVAVKPASTAAVAADKALVVAVSPNNTVAVTELGTWAVELNSGGSLVGQQAMAASVPVVIASNQSSIPVTGAADATVGPTALGALNATVSLAASGYAGMGMFLAAGTLQGTIIAEVSMDGGTTWVTGSFYDPTLGINSQTVVFASNNTATTRSLSLYPGVSHARVRVSAYTSGSANCSLRATATDTLVSQGPAGNIGEAWSIQVTDHVNGPAAVKPASTAAAAADPAMVVAISPNNAVAVTESGTWAVELNSGGSLVGQTTMSASVPVTIASDQSALKAQGTVASGVAASGNPLQDGGVASVATAPTAVSSGQMVALQLDKFGRNVVQQHAPLDRQEQAFLTLTTTARTSVFSAGSGSNRHAVTHIHVSNTSATPVLVQIQDGSTNLWDTYAAAGGGGAEADFSLPLLGTAATALNVQLGAAVTDVRVTVVGYQTV